MEGVFNTTGRTNVPDTYTYTPQNEQEAWIAIMHACVAVDDDVADVELDEMAQTLADRGIEWRGTRYPLAELRKSMPILWP